MVAMVLLAACGQSKTNRAGATANDSSAKSASDAKSTGSAGSAATGQTATGTPAATASAGAVPRVVLMGTSLTAGYGLDPSDAYPALLQKLADSLHYRVNVVNAGLSGETLAGALRRVGWVLEQPAAAVVLEVGANDGLRGVDPDSTEASIEALIDSVRQKQPAARIGLVQMEAPPNFGRDFTTRFHAVYKRAATRKGVELYPFLLDSVAGIAALNQSDGIHPNRRGAPIVARNMLRALTPLFVSLSSGAQSTPVNAASGTTAPGGPPHP